MAGPEVVGFQLSVDMKGLTAQLATIPGITKTAATAMVKELRDSYRASEQASKSLANNVKKDMGEVTKATGGARAGAINLMNQMSDVAIQMEQGAPIGRIALQQGSQVVDALGMMGISFTRLLTVVAPVGLAIGALALVYSELVEEQAKAEAGMAAAAAEATALSEALDKVATSQAKLDDALSLAEGTATKGQLAQRDAVLAIREQYEPLLSARRENIAALEREAAAAQDLETAANARGSIKAAQEQADARERLRSRIAAERAELGNLTTAQDVAINTAVQTIAATERAEEATRELTEAEKGLQIWRDLQIQWMEADYREQSALADIDKERTAGIQRLMAITSEAEASQLDDVGRVTAALEKQLATIRAITAETADMARTPEEEAGIVERGLEAEVAATAAANAQIREIRQKEDEARDLEAKRELERQRDIQRAAVDAVQSSLDIMTQGFGDLYDNRAEIVTRLEEQLDRSEEYLTDDQRAELEKRIELQRSAARRAFEIAKAFKIGQAVINTFAGINEALASAPPPVNFISAAAVGAAGFANVAAIASTQPAFHRGGMIDEMPINALRGEAVLSRQGRAVIGDETINQANAGASVGGGSTVIYQVYDRRILDRVAVSTIRAGGRLDGYIRAQRTTPYGHRS